MWTNKGLLILIFAVFIYTTHRLTVPGKLEFGLDGRFKVLVKLPVSQS